jgi:signal transduction histidine kinase
MKKQQGLTMISMAVVIVFVLFQAVIAMNVIPVYMTDSSVADVLEKVDQDPKSTGMSTRELKDSVLKRLRLNSVYDIKPEYVKVKKGRGENIVTIEYEPRGKLIGSLDFIVTFSHEVRIPIR